MGRHTVHEAYYLLFEDGLHNLFLDREQEGQLQPLELKTQYQKNLEYRMSKLMHKINQPMGT